MIECRNNLHPTVQLATVIDSYICELGLGLFPFLLTLSIRQKPFFFFIVPLIEIGMTVSLASAGIAISGGGLRGFCVGLSIWLSSSAASSLIGGVSRLP